MAEAAEAATNRKPIRWTCRICGAPDSVVPFLSLGTLALGNAFVPLDEAVHEPSFPLDVGFCEACYLVHVVTPAPVESLEKVYRNYSYVPTGRTLADHYDRLAADIVSVVRPSERALFVDIGSNDGLLLSRIRHLAPGVRLVGVEPATRIAGIATERGIPTISGFFGPATADRIRTDQGAATVISTTQVLQHIRDPVALLRSVSGLLAPEGVFVTEGRAYFPDVAEKLSFDTFYHELLCCFTLNSLEKLLARAGLMVFHAERTEAYGGSLRVFAQKEGGTREVRSSVRDLRGYEAKQGLREADTYRAFGKRVEAVRDRIAAIVRDLRSRGHSVAGYGAPSTGTTLLAYCGLGKNEVEYIVDDNPLKQGLVTPGTHIPIVAPDGPSTHPPDYLLLIAWRLREEILAKVGPWRKSGLHGVILPLPHPEVVE